MSEVFEHTNWTFGVAIVHSEYLFYTMISMM